MLASECWSSRVVIGIWRRKRRGGRLYLPPVQTELKTQVILFSFKAIGIFSLFWNCIYFESLWGVIYFLRWIWIADSNITFILLSVDCVGGVRFSLFWVYFSLAISLSHYISTALSLSLRFAFTIHHSLVVQSILALWPSVILHFTFSTLGAIHDQLLHCTLITCSHCYFFYLPFKMYWIMIKCLLAHLYFNANTKTLSSATLTMQWSLVNVLSAYLWKDKISFFCDSFFIKQNLFIF